MTRFLWFFRSAIIAGALAATLPAPAGAQVSVGLSVNIGPPALPVYVQPPAPAPGYMWTPGYWAWGPAGYFWVPGTWVLAPQPGLLWTPGYWAYDGGAYGWHPGYWGYHVGYYGGISYGFGYFGAGYVGGGWYGNAFRYNTAFTNVNTTVIKNVYVDKTVVNNYNTANNTTVNRVSYNGGPGGVSVTPSPQEQTVAMQQRFPMTADQKAHVHTASQDRNMLASVNRGAPASAAVAQPLSKRNRPEGFTPITPSDREVAQKHVVSAPAPRNSSYEHSAQPNTNSEYHAQTARHSGTTHPQGYEASNSHPQSYNAKPPPPHQPSHPQAPHPAEPKN